MKIRDVITLLEKDAWQLLRQRGSDRQYRHEQKPALVRWQENSTGVGAGDPQQYFQAGEAEAMRFLIVIEKAKRGFSAYSPGLPGCVAAEATRRGVQKAMREAIEFHLEGLREEGSRVPPPQSYSTYVDVPA